MAKDIKGIPYKMVPIKDTINETPKQGFIPRIVRRETIPTEIIVKKLSDASSFTAADIYGVIQGLVDEIDIHLQLGFNVTIDGLGTFSLSAEGPMVEKEDDIRANSIRVKRIIFKAARSFSNRFKTARFQKVEKR